MMCRGHVAASVLLAALLVTSTFLPLYPVRGQSYVALIIDLSGSISGPITNAQIQISSGMMTVETTNSRVVYDLIGTPSSGCGVDEVCTSSSVMSASDIQFQYGYILNLQDIQVSTLSGSLPSLGMFWLGSAPGSGSAVSQGTVEVYSILACSGDGSVTGSSVVIDLNCSAVPSGGSTSSSHSTTSSSSTTSAASCPISQVTSGSDTFTLFWITDTQYLSEPSSSSDYDLTTTWIAKNFAACNGQMVIHTGDITQDGSTCRQGDNACINEWSVADHAMSILSDPTLAGLTVSPIPYTWDAGNHDGCNGWGDNTLTSCGTDSYPSYLGDSLNKDGQPNYPAFYPAHVASAEYQNWIENPDNPSGVFHDGMDTAVKFTYSGQTFVVLNIEYNGDAQLGWVKDLLSAYSGPTDHVIIATHDYLNPVPGSDNKCGVVDLGDQFKSDLTTLLNKYPQVVMVLSGHYQASQGCQRQDQTSKRWELMFDRQGNEGETTAASVTTLTFDVSGNRVYGNTFYVPTGEVVQTWAPMDVRLSSGAGSQGLWDTIVNAVDEFVNSVGAAISGALNWVDNNVWKPLAGFFSNLLHSQPPSQGKPSTANSNKIAIISAKLVVVTGTIVTFPPRLSFGVSDESSQAVQQLIVYVNGENMGSPPTGSQFYPGVPFYSDVFVYSNLLQVTPGQTYSVTMVATFADGSQDRETTTVLATACQSPLSC